MNGPIAFTAFDIAQRFIGLAETPGVVHTPQVVAMLELVDRRVRDDETPWCAAFVNYVAWLLNLPRANSLSARAWLKVGTSIPLEQARPGYDVVVLSRGEYAPPATVLNAPGHVGFFAGFFHAPDMVRVLGGNQKDQVCFADFPVSHVLGVRRLA
jgi:uncharacterized protein (TIGR02594 family)